MVLKSADDQKRREWCKRGHRSPQNEPCESPFGPPVWRHMIPFSSLTAQTRYQRRLRRPKANF